MYIYIYVRVAGCCTSSVAISAQACIIHLPSSSAKSPAICQADNAAPNGPRSAAILQSMPRGGMQAQVLANVMAKVIGG